MEVNGSMKEHKHTSKETSNLEENIPSRAFRPQVVLGLTGFFVGISVGTSLGHSAVLLPVLQSSNSTLFIDEETGSWIASTFAASGPVGSFLSGIAIEWWGRRKIAFISSSGMAIGWLFICLAPSASILITGRIIEGFSKSALATSFTVLSDELSEPKYRGFMISLINTHISIGVMIIMGLGSLLDWRSASGVSAFLSLITAMSFYFLKESPSWLVKRNRLEEASESLQWLWGPGQEEKAYNELGNFATRFLSEGEQQTNKGFDIKYFKKLFNAHTMKPFLILHVFNTIQVFCGLNIFTFYSIDILSRIRTLDGDGSYLLGDNESGLLISLMRIFANVVCTALILRIGRRTIALVSGVGATIAASFLSLSLFLPDMFLESTAQNWFRFVTLVTFVTFHAFGYYNLPSLMLGETQPMHIRGLACGYIYTLNDLVLSGALKVYPSFMSNFEVNGLFLMFGVSCLLCTVFVYLFLPETKDRTLEEIEDYFKMSNIMWITRRKDSEHVRCNAK